MKPLGIMAYGSVIRNPGKELIAATEIKLDNQQTPFAVEFAHASKYRNGAPTLVPVEDGSRVSCFVFIMKEGISEKEATNILFRREIGQPGSRKEYPSPEKGKKNTVYVEKIHNFNGVQTVLYTKILPDIKPLTAEELAKRAIESALSEAGERGIDGVSYLKNAIAAGIQTALSPDYEKVILKSTQAMDLDQAICILAVERMKKQGKVPQEAEAMFKIPTIEDVGKFVAIRATIGETYIKLAPPIEIISLGENAELKLKIEYKHKYAAKFLGLEATISNSYLYVGFPQGTKLQNVLDYFNNLIAIWNILRFPMDFITRSDILVRAKGLGGYLELISSSRAHYRGYGLTPTQLTFEEFLELETLTEHLWQKISSSKYFEKDTFFQLLGYATYYLYHGVDLLSFTHSWMFIESCINLLWGDLIDDVFHKAGIKDD